MTTLQCNEMVTETAGFGIRQCSRDAIEDSNYCQQHHDKRYPPKFTATDHLTEPETRERVTVSATLKWRVGDGPTLKPKHATKPLAITSVRITLDSDDGRASLGMSGVNLKKDGTASQVTSSSRYLTMDELPDATRELIETEIHRLRSMLPGGVL